MKTMKEYKKPEIKTFVVNMPTALMAGSQTGVNPSGDDWDDNTDA